MNALQKAVQDHVERQHRLVSEAAARGEDLPDSFPLDQSVIEYVHPESKVPSEAASLGQRLGAIHDHYGVGHYRGCFSDSDDVRHVINVDTDGDLGFLVVLDTNCAVLACARRDVERLTWLSLEELLNEMGTALSGR